MLKVKELYDRHNNRNCNEDFVITISMDSVKSFMKN